MSSAHALTFLYLTVGQATDGTLTSDEMRTLADKLKKRAPELSLEELGVVLRESVATYKQAGTREKRLEQAAAHAEALRDLVDENMRSAIVDDLRAVAEADGNVSPEELEFIDRIAATMGVGD